MTCHLPLMQSQNLVSLLMIQVLYGDYLTACHKTFGQIGGTQATRLNSHGVHYDSWHS
jgi:hypothetical protein